MRNYSSKKKNTYQVHAYFSEKANIDTYERMKYNSFRMLLYTNFLKYTIVFFFVIPPLDANTSKVWEHAVVQCSNKVP